MRTFASEGAPWREGLCSQAYDDLAQITLTKS
jgi:hypothetical protein